MGGRTRPPAAGRARTGVTRGQNRLRRTPGRLAEACSAPRSAAQRQRARAGPYGADVVVLTTAPAGPRTSCRGRARRPGHIRDPEPLIAIELEVSARPRGLPAGPDLAICPVLRKGCCNSRCACGATVRHLIESPVPPPLKATPIDPAADPPPAAWRGRAGRSAAGVSVGGERVCGPAPGTVRGRATQVDRVSYRGSAFSISMARTPRASFSGP